MRKNRFIATVLTLVFLFQNIIVSGSMSYKKSDESGVTNAALISLTALTVTDSAIELVWTSGNKDIKSELYDICRDGAVILSADGFTFTDTNLMPETQYKYKIVAKAKDGNTVAESNEITLTTKASKTDLAVPKIANLKASDITDTSLLLTWECINTKGMLIEYEIYCNNNLAKAVKDTQAIIDKLMPDTEYTLRVQIKNSETSETGQSLQIKTLPPMPEQAPLVKISSDHSNKKAKRFIVKYKNTYAIDKRSSKIEKANEEFDAASNDVMAQVFKGKLEKAHRIDDINNNAYEIVTMNSETTIEEFAAELNQNSVKNEIEYIQPDYELSLSSLDPHFNEQWALENDDESDSLNEADLDDNIEIIRSVLPHTASIIESDPDFLDLFDNIPAGELLDKIEDMDLPDSMLSEVVQEICTNPVIKDLLAAQQENDEPEYLCDAEILPAWEQSTGEGTVVAVIDTGIDVSHEDLSQSIWINQYEIPDNGLDDDSNGYIDDINGWDFKNDTNTVHNQLQSMDEKHGTHIAGIIGAVKDNGIGIAGAAPDSKIMTLKVFENGTAYTSDIIEAINYAASEGVKIINCSWGGTEDNPILKETIQNKSDILFICAPGNNGVNIDEAPIYPASFDCPNIITVASVNRNGSLSGFSNFGQNSVDVAAPGKDIFSTTPSDQYEESSGTSMSAAFVSAEAAVLMSKLNTVSLSEVKERIINCSDRLSSLTGKVFQGGKINFVYALNYIISTDIIEAADNNTNKAINQILEQGGGFSLFSAPSADGEFVKVLGGESHSLALKKDGTVWAFGSNSYGKLGDGTTTTRIYPVQVSGLNGVIAIAAGDNHSLALKSDGTVWAWGYNREGQLGNVTNTTSYIPVHVSNLSSVTSIATIDDTSLALRNDGTVWAWGENNDGELGNGTLTNSNIPVQVSNLVNVVAIAGGDDHSLALKNDGTVWVWGKNLRGQLGTNNNMGSNIPVQVSALSNVTAIVGGDDHSLALKADGTVWAWGENDDGELGNGTTEDSLVPVQVNTLNNVVSIASAYTDHNVALKNDGTIWAWGDNDHGQLGDGTNLDRTSAVQINNVFNIAGIGAGGNTTFIVKSDGTVWGCGSNSNGKLGNREYEYSAISVYVSDINDVKGVSAGGFHNIAVKNDGTVYTWGAGDDGQLGNGTLMDNAIPSQVPGLTGITEADAGYLHCLALKSDGTVWGWGNNIYGQLGDGTTTKRLIPTQLAGLNNVVALSVGEYHSLALKSDGTVWAWGYNEDGELGDGTIINKETPVQVSGLSNIISISAGQYHNLALSSNGAVYAWGYNYCGQLGDGSTANKTTPVQVSGLSNVSSIIAGGYHNLVLTNNGLVYSWGYNGYGQLGDGTSTNRNTPVQVSGLIGTASISGGVHHSIAVMSDGTVSVWGLNYNGQLGDGTTSIRRAPVQITGLSGIVKASASEYHSVLLKNDGTLCAFGSYLRGRLGNGNLGYFSAAQWLFGTAVTSKFIKIASFDNHNLALKNDGTVWAWGYNHCGQLGDGTNTTKSIAFKINGLSNVIDIACGDSHSMALKSDGTVWVWGRNLNGQLGDGTKVDKKYPVLVTNLGSVSSIAAGADNSIALKADGTLYAWGYNGYGQLGDNTYTDRLIPVAVSSMSDVKEIACGFFHVLAVKNDGTLWSWGRNTFGQLGIGHTTTTKVPVMVNTLSQIKQISGGGIHSAALKADGSVWTWGDNSSGQLGDGTLTNRALPVQIQLNGINNISCGYYHSLALNSDGDIWAWGNNSYGQIGDGTVSSQSNPVQVSALNSVINVAAGNYHGLAQKSDGTVWAWGYNNDGQLGNGSYSNSNTPVQVSGLSEVTVVTSGGLHNLVLKSDGSVWAWGHNGFGQLGDGTTTTRRTPVRVSGLSGIIAISGGEYHSLALKNDGTVWAWGRNTNGELGDGTNTNRLTPVQINGISAVSSIECGAFHSLALKSDGTVLAWGSNEYGKLGNGTATNTNVPIQISALNNISSVNGAQHHSFAVANDGSVYAWGYNGHGELGDGTYTNRNTPVQLSGLTGFVAISGGLYHNVAVKNDGTLWSWGYNRFGQLGSGLNNTVNAPAQVSSVSGIQRVSAGYYFSIVLKNDGTIWTFGDNFYGQLGNGASGVVTNPKRVYDSLDFEPPSKPQALRTALVDLTKIALVWNPSTDNSEEGVKEYIIYRNGAEFKTVSLNSFEDLSILPGTEYSYYVIARDYAGNISEPSDSITVVTPKPPLGIPKNLKATAEYNRIHLMWDRVDGAAGYEIMVDGQPIKLTRTEYIHEGLANGTMHIYKVRATEGIRFGEYSESISVATLIDLPQPAGLSAKVSGSDIILTWCQVQHAAQYEILIDNNITQIIDKNTFVHQNASMNQAHTYKVRAGLFTSVSPWSQSVSVNNMTPTAGNMVIDQSSGVQIDFYSVSNSGGTSVVKYTGAPDVTIPGVVFLPEYYDISSQANYLPPVKLKIPYNFNGTAQDEQKLRLYHYVGGTYVDITGNAGPNINGNYIEGNVNEFCLFAVGLPLPIPVNIKTSLGETGVTMSWDKINEAASYEVSFDGSLETISNPSFIKSGLEKGSVHQFKVRGLFNGIPGNWSDEIIVRIGGSIPTNLKAELDGFSVNLTWDKEFNAERYNVYMNDKIIADGVLDTRFRHKGLMPETAYSFTVTSITNGTNESEKSMPVHIITSKDQTPPEVPGNLRVYEVHNTSLTLEWDESFDNCGVSGYEVFRDGVLIGTTETDRFTDNTLQKTTSYMYHIRAFDVSGNKSNTSILKKIMTLSDDHSDVKENATPLEFLIERYGSIETKGDKDWFLINNVIDREYSIRGRGDSELIGILYDESQNIISNSEDGNASNNGFRLNVSLKQGKKYYLHVKCKDNLDKGNYGVKLFYNSNELDAENNYSDWMEKAAQPLFGVYQKAVVANNIIYVFDGADYKGKNKSNVYQYNPLDNTFITKAEIPNPTTGFGTAESNGLIYVMGGASNSTSNKVQAYDPTNNLWVQKAHLTVGRTGLATSQVNGKIYAIGGVNKSGYLSIVEEYDPASDTWISKRSMPTARAFAAVAAYQNKIYVIGGHNSDGIALNTVEIYDPATDTWKTAAPIKTARSGCQAEAVNGRIVIIGGYNGKILNAVEEYKISNNTCSYSGFLNTARMNAASVIHGEKIYVIGGKNSKGYTKSIEINENILLKFKINTTSNDQTYSFPIESTEGALDIVVDWGDGTVSTISSYSQRGHNYQKAGYYTIKVLSFIKLPLSFSGDSNVIEILSSLPDLEKYSFREMFNNCINLATIPANLFYNNIGVRDFAYCFNNCFNLKLIPNSLFKYNPLAINYSACFEHCKNITSIPERLFSNNPRAEAFVDCFNHCSGLISIPEELFASNPKAKWFGCEFLYSDGCFSNCSNLTSIPENLFANNPLVTDFGNCFKGCSSLISIPETLFSKNPLVRDFSFCFYGCSSLTIIPKNLYKNNPLANSFRGCFNGCSALVNIPQGLFANNPNVINFGSCFSRCRKIVNIPEDLFANNTSAKFFWYCFNDCSSLTNIPKALFMNNHKATIFSSCFSGCISLTSIPESLFVNNLLADDFSYCFNSCTSLTNIPEGLFINNSSVKDFSSCFSECINITSIPKSLFAKNILANEFRYCFSKCTSLTNIPADLFASNSLVTDFTACFSECTSLTIIPENLFVNNSLVTDFTDCFNRCSNLISIPSDLFIHNSKVTSFSECFFHCIKLTGLAPNLWSRVPQPQGGNCFYECRGLSNYAEIPNSWK